MTRYNTIFVGVHARHCINQTVLTEWKKEKEITWIIQQQQNMKGSRERKRPRQPNQRKNEWCKNQASRVAIESAALLYAQHMTKLQQFFHPLYYSTLHTWVHSQWMNRANTYTHTTDSNLLHQPPSFWHIKFHNLLSSSANVACRARYENAIKVWNARSA